MADRSAAERPTLLALHGLGATAGVWAGLRAHLGDEWTVVAPDLAGHGASPWSGDYTVGALAAGVSAEFPATGHPGPVVAVGHSLGGAVALALASGLFRPVIDAVVAVGVKTVWTDDDIAGMAKVAERGIRWCDTEAEAIERALRQSGLVGLAAPDGPEVANAVVEESDRWRVTQDPATFAQRPLDMAGLMAAARCPVVLAAGEADPMATPSQLANHTERPRIAAGQGHNVHVEDPAWVAGLVTEIASADRPS